MAMVELTKSLAVSDKLIDGISVCCGCRGSGQRAAWAGWLDLMIVRHYCCPVCWGRGFFPAGTFQ